jgi:hypothetical protein
MQEFPLAILANHFATCAVARIYGQNVFLAEGWSEQKLSKVIGKDIDRPGICTLFGG